MFFRLDAVQKVKTLDAVPDYDTYIEMLADHQKHLWGVAAGQDSHLEHLEMILRLEEKERHVVGRLERKKRCGKVEQLSDTQWRFTADVYDTQEWSINWRNYSLDNLFSSDMNEAERRAVIIFASFSPNGFIRERAVRLMKDYPGTLPFAILRQNDWVSQVRSAAAEAADYRLSHLSNRELINALPFADKLSRSGRTKTGNIYVNRIYTALTANEEELIDGLSTANIRTRRICTSALFNADIPRYDLAFIRLQKESDPFLRTKIFKGLMSAEQNMDAVIEQFLKDKYPMNRMLAFQYISGTNKDKAFQIAKELLLDKSTAVRENVRFYINKGLDKISET